MKYSLICFVAILLVATPAAAQELQPSSLIVETLDPVPSVVKSGELFTQTYRVRFLDLTHRGEEVVIFEDRMDPESLVLPLLVFNVKKGKLEPTKGKFEPMGLEIYKRKGRNGEYIWDFKYTLMVIYPEKGPYFIPSINFYWAKKELGKDISSAEVMPFPSREVPMSYVTTITSDPYLDIRDLVDFGDYSAVSRNLKYAAWALAALLIFGWAGLFVSVARSSSRKFELEEEDKTDKKEKETPTHIGRVSSFRAKLKLYKIANKLMRYPKFDIYSRIVRDELLKADVFMLEAELVIALKDLMRANFPEINIGDSPKDILEYVQHLKSGPKRDAYYLFAEKLVRYQSDVETDMPDNLRNLHKEGAEIKKALRRSSPLIRHCVWLRERRFVRRFWLFFKNTAAKARWRRK